MTRLVIALACVMVMAAVAGWAHDVVWLVVAGAAFAVTMVSLLMWVEKIEDEMDDLCGKYRRGEGVVE